MTICTMYIMVYVFYSDFSYCEDILSVFVKNPYKGKHLFRVSRYTA